MENVDRRELELTHRVDKYLNRIILGDCLDILRRNDFPTVDLVFTSPPYEDARINCCKLKGEAWVDWAFERYSACHSACRGLTAWVVNGRTRNFRWSATPILLMESLYYADIPLRKPPVFHRVGIPGSGGPDWLRDDYEFIICSSEGKLPWSDNTACGNPPKFGPGGPPSHRLPDGSRINAKVQTRRKPDGSRPRDGLYKPPKIANPGNVISLGAVGGGNMGSKLCHLHPAPFPEALAEFFIKSFCPPEGVVCDPFAGSGTTLAVAKRLKRKYIGIEVDPKWVKLCERRVKEVQGG